jgi:RNA-splicing ligase RtcB
MKICQEFAWLNREFIAVKILEFLNIKINICDKFHTVHNYIDFDDNILRKGAIACKKNHRVTIGLNMRDGSLLGIGKGNDDWNQSGPHGAGRIMSRTQAKKEISMEDYKNSMNGIYTTSINKSTIDESPFAYKDYQEIMDLVGETVTIVGRIKPVYNFKAGE